MDQLRKRFDQLTWPEASCAASQPGATVIWPFGACEQHGPQLPLSTDAVFAEGILDSVLRGLEPALPIWRLPCQAIGFSPEHQNFPGTLSLSAPLILDLVDQVGTQLAAMGTLCEFLGRYDAEGLQGRFEAAGLQTVEDLVAAGLGEAELIKLGVEPLWRRRSLLSGIAEAKRDKVSVCLCRAACAAH